MREVSICHSDSFSAIELYASHSILIGGLQKKERSDAYRRAEQLVVYVRALHMLSSALLLAQRQIAAGTLHPSHNVQHVLNQLNDKYHHCLVSTYSIVTIR